MKYFLFPLLLFCSCTKNTLLLNSKFNKYSIVKADLILAREICNGITYSFCRYDSHQSYRDGPYLLPKNLINTSNPYALVFTTEIDDETSLDSLAQLLPELREKINVGLFDSLSNTKFNTICYYNQVHKKAISTNKNGLSFDGYYCFQLFKVKLEAIYLGKRTIINPNFDPNKPKPVTLQRKADLFYIYRIKSIAPFLILK